MASEALSAFSGGEICSLVKDLSLAIDRNVRRAAEQLALTESQAVALRELSEPMSLRALSQRMRCEASNATYVADRLEEAGLLTRRPHPTDRRAKELHLTPKGASTREALLSLLNGASPLDGLTEVELVTLRELLLRATAVRA